MIPRSLILIACLVLSEPSFAQSWKFISPMKHARAQHQAVLLNNGEILAIGGENGTNVLKSCEIYDPSTDTWRDVDSMHEARHRFSAFVLSDGRVFVAGGLNVLGINPPTKTSATCEIYDPKTNVWKYTASLNQAREVQEACLAGRQIAIFAGLDANDGSYPNTGDMFDIPTERMSAVPRLPACAAMGAIQYSPVSNAIYVMGGNQSGYGGFKSKSTQKFSLATRTWSLVDSMLDRQGALFNTVVYPKTGEIFVFTNDTAYNLKLTRRVAAFDPHTEHWRDAGIITPRSDPHASLVDDSVILVGGIDSTGSGMKSTSWYNLTTGISYEGPQLLEPVLASISLFAPNSNSECDISRNVYVIGGKLKGYPYQNSNIALDHCEVLTLSASQRSNRSLRHRAMATAFNTQPEILPLLVDVSATLKIDSLWQYVHDISASYSWDSSVLQYGAFQPPTGWTLTALATSAGTVTFTIHKISGADTVPLNLGTATFYPISNAISASQVMLLDANLNTTDRRFSLCIQSDEGHEWWVRTLGEADVRNESTDSHDFSVFPNPASNVLCVQTAYPLTIFDALGRSYNVPNSGGTLDVSSLPAGVYYVLTGSREAVRHTKFVKE
jgi:hypothetical protein